jgi:hypothetical protein
MTDTGTPFVVKGIAALSANRRKLRRLYRGLADGATPGQWTRFDCITPFDGALPKFVINSNTTLLRPNKDDKKVVLTYLISRNK